MSNQTRVYNLQAAMAGHQAAAGTLKATLGSRAACLTEQDYVNLVEQGFDSPEALLDARDKSLEAILARQGAVDAVLAWQAERKPAQLSGKSSSQVHNMLLSNIMLL